MTDTEIEAAIESAVRKAGTSNVSPETKKQLGEYLRQVDSWGERMHLVGKGRRGATLGLLLLDSFLLLRAAEENVPGARKAADIGSGAGFPGMVWKIVRPELGVTLFERKLKPQAFLERIAGSLRLDRIEIFGGDAADYDSPEIFDVVVSKAAGRLEGLLPIAERLLRNDGAYLTIKGSSWRSEVSGSGEGSIRFESATNLPENRGTALLFRKVRTR
jgi:16S rRNA (guanine527-N7)-methyltransferase